MVYIIPNLVPHVNLALLHMHLRSSPGVNHPLVDCQEIHTVNTLATGREDKQLKQHLAHGPHEEAFPPAATQAKHIPN